MSTAKEVRDEATKLFTADQSSGAPLYNDFTDVLPSVCEKHGHPILQDGLCLCKMLCNSNDEEVVMTAVLFISADDSDDEGADLDSESFVVFLPENGREDLSSPDDVAEVLETYEDQGAAKVTFADLVAAYNQVHGTNFEV